MRTLILVVLALLLAACGEKPAPVATAPAPAAKVAPIGPAEDDLATAEAATAEQTQSQNVAVDEPLPPLEEISGIVTDSISNWSVADPEVEISGKVLLYTAPDGSRLLRLEDLRTPKDLRIDLALSNSARPASPEEARAARVVGALKGPSGNMNYLLEAGISLNGVVSFVLLENGQGRILASAPRSRPAEQ